MVRVVGLSGLSESVGFLANIKNCKQTALVLDPKPH